LVIGSVSLAPRGALACALVLVTACGARSELPAPGAGGASASTSSTGTSSTSSTGAGGAPTCGETLPGFTLTVPDTSFEGVATDRHGRTFVKGSYWPKDLLGPDTTNTLEYVLALSPTGSIDWATPLPGPQMTGFGGSLRNIGSDGDDAFVATGDGGMALSRIAADGHVAWQVRAKVTSQPNAPLVAVGADSAPVVGGLSTESVDWGGGPLDVLGEGASFGSYVVGFDAAGHLAWQHAWPHVAVADLARDDAGTTFVLGSSVVADTIAPGVPASSGNFLLLLGPDGAVRSLTDLGSWQASRVALDHAGSVVVAGVALSSFQVGQVPIEPPPGGGLVVVRLDLEGAWKSDFALPGARPSLITPAMGARCARIGIAMAATTPLSFGGPTYDAAPNALGFGWVGSNGVYQGSLGRSTTAIPPLALDVDPSGVPVLALDDADAELAPPASGIVSAIIKPSL
jgi:hypothetical protein